MFLSGVRASKLLYPLRNPRKKLKRVGASMLPYLHEIPNKALIKYEKALIKSTSKRSDRDKHETYYLLEELTVSLY